MNKLKKKLGEVFSGDGFFSSTATVALISIVMVVNILLYIVVQTFELYLYDDEEPDFSISGNTDDLFAPAIEKGQKATITFCSPKDDVEDHETGKYVHQTAKNFEARYDDLIDIEYLNLVTMQKDSGDGAESTEYVDLTKYKTDMQGNATKIRRTSIIFECGTNYRVVTDTYTAIGYAPFFTLDSNRNAIAYNGEEVMASMLSWVLAPEHKTVYFTQYHGEIVDIEFSNLLASAGYYVNVIDLRSNEIPADADLVIISSPTSDFEQAREGSGIRAEIDRLRTYMERGGNLYVSLDPYIKKSMPILYGFLAEWGIKLSTSLDSEGNEVNNIVKDYNNAITTNGFTLVTDYADNDVASKIKDRVNKYTNGDVIVSMSSALELSDNAKPLLVSSSSSVLEAEGETKSRKGSYCVAAYSEKSTEQGTSKLFVIPNIYLAVMDSLISNGYSNKDFVYSLLGDFYGEGMMPYGCKPIMYDNQSLQNLTMGTAKIYTALIMMVPVGVCAAGIVILVRRKNR